MKALTLRLEDRLHRDVAVYCAQRGVKIQAFVSRLLEARVRPRRKATRTAAPPDYETEKHLPEGD